MKHTTMCAAEDSRNDSRNDRCKDRCKDRCRDVVRWRPSLRFHFTNGIALPRAGVCCVDAAGTVLRTASGLAKADPSIHHLARIRDQQEGRPLAHGRPLAPWPHLMWKCVVHNQGWGLVSWHPSPWPFDALTLQEVVDLWTAGPGDLTDAEFHAAFDREACTDTNKMADVRALRNLPFPRKVVVFAVAFLCRYMCANVTSVADWLACVRAACDVDLPE